MLRDDLQGLQFLAEEAGKRELKVNFNYTGKRKRNDQLICLFQKIAQTEGNFEIGGAWFEPFHNTDYHTQKEAMTALQQEIISITGQPMKTFSSKSSVLDENTIRIAEELGIHYLFGRGDARTEAVVYKPEEYNVCMIANSDILYAGQHGTLSDGSLLTRGATAGVFQQLLGSVHENRITFSIQSQLSGRDKEWWAAASSMLDRADIKWCGIDEFAAKPLVMPLKEIPIHLG